MVKFLVQNSLGATWMGMHPESKLSENWEYYVRDADRVVERNSFRSSANADRATATQNERNEFRSTTKPIAEITFLDPACGSGHFLLEAFDLFYDMYEEEDRLCDSALCVSLRNLPVDPGKQPVRHRHRRPRGTDRRSRPVDEGRRAGIPERISGQSRPTWSPPWPAT